MGTVSKKAGKATKRAAARRSAKAPSAKKKTSKAPTTAARPPQRNAAKAAGSRRPAKKSSPTPNIVVDADVLEFIAALDAFKARHGRPFPSWSEVLHVLRGLGYRKV